MNSPRQRQNLIKLSMVMSLIFLLAPTLSLNLSLVPRAEAQQSRVIKRGGKAVAQEAIKAVLDAQVAAWNKGDLEGYMAGYWQSPELSFFSGKNVTHSWQATLDRYRQRYQSAGSEMGKLSFSELEIEPLGPESAFVRGHWQLQLSKENVGGLFTLVFKKLPVGWRIIHDHTSG